MTKEIVSVQNTVEVEKKSWQEYTNVAETNFKSQLLQEHETSQRQIEELQQKKAQVTKMYKKEVKEMADFFDQERKEMTQKLTKLESLKVQNRQDESEKIAKIHALEHQAKSLQDVHQMYVKEKQNYE